MQSSTNNLIAEDFYENQWKCGFSKSSKYSYSGATFHKNRPVFSTINGKPVLPKACFMTPNPRWIWADSWHIDHSSPNDEGWIYSDDWKSHLESREFTTKLRFRRWIRHRCLKNEIDEKYNRIEFIYEIYEKKVQSLNNFIPPFLKRLNTEVMNYPGMYDFNSLAAIPSPRMRRILKSMNANDG
jgi:hypothetical protein